VRKDIEDRWKPFNVFSPSTLMCAHLVKKEMLKYFATSEDAIPEVLEATARLLGSDAAGNAPRSAKAAALARQRGAPLLTWSVRNILLMPKAMEKSMDSSKWVFEPVLPGDPSPSPRDSAEGAARPKPWESSHWRLRCLVPADDDPAFSTQDDQTMIDTALQSSDHKKTTREVGKDSNGRDCQVVIETQRLVPLSAFKGRTFEFEWDRISMRALVVVYLFTLWNCFEPSGVRNHALLTAGVARVRGWVRAIREQKPTAAKMEEEQQPGPSLGQLEEWLETLDVDGCRDAALAQPVPDDDGAAESGGVG
jgi:hypothetical protein